MAGVLTHDRPRSEGGVRVPAIHPLRRQRRALHFIVASTAYASQVRHPTTHLRFLFPIAAGMGVLRSSDGSLLRLRLTGGSDCVDFNAGHALVSGCTRWSVERGASRTRLKMAAR